jgi:hypothetical protein
MYFEERKYKIENGKWGNNTLEPLKLLKSSLKSKNTDSLLLEEKVPAGRMRWEDLGGVKHETLRP